jgi:protein-S-isoprenylcysteine O-methyltransferase Ste14
MKKYPFLNIFFVAIFAVGRFILVLPSLPQPRFFIYNINWIVGGSVFIIGLIFLIPLLQISPFPSTKDRIILNTRGFYGITRNPIYLGEILWTLGWSIMFGSIIGVILVPLWWGGLLLNIMLEEEELERNIGQYYIDYKQQVEGRIIPGLPI